MLLTRERQFYQLLRAAAENALETAQQLIALLEDPSRFAELGPAIKELESKGDRYTHDLYALVHKSFLTPLDKGDLIALGVAIDSLVDAMDAAAARIGIFKVTRTDRWMKAFGQTIRAQAAELVSAIDLLAGGRLAQIHDRTVQVNFLENQGDETLRGGLSALFAEASADPVRFMTMKEIYETLEEATDRAEDVANLLEGVVMKRG